MIDVDDEQALVPVPAKQPQTFEDLVQETHELLRRKRLMDEEYIKVIIKIGENLNEMQSVYNDKRKGYGEFIPFVEKEFNLKVRTIREYRCIASVYGSNGRRAAHLPDYPQRVLSVLAAPSTSEEVRQLVESGLIPPTREAIRAANKARMAIKKVEQWVPEEQFVEGTIESSEIVEEEPTLEIDRCKILDPCPIAKLHERVEAGTLDAIITDPPYPREYLSVYEDLADFAIHALKPGGSLVVMVGQSYLPEIMDMLRKKPLNYHWLSCYYVPGGTTKIWPRRIGASWKPLLWFVKEEYKGEWKKDVTRDDTTTILELLLQLHELVLNMPPIDNKNSIDAWIEHRNILLDEIGSAKDAFFGSASQDIFVGKQKDKKHHKWGQPEEDMVNIIEHFTQPGQLVCDPFLGGGTTAVASLVCNRRFIGSDIDTQCVQTTRKRVKDTLEMLEESQREQSA